MVFMRMTFRTLVLFILLYGAAGLLYADSYSGADSTEARIIRAPVWVFLEPQPGVMDSSEQGPQLPIRQALTELSRTVLEGMTFGWRFTYTPFDKQRQVAEVFELVPIQPIDGSDTRLSLTELRAQYPYLYCWAEYRISDAMTRRWTEWQTIAALTAKGRGSADRKQELDGIRQAYREAAKSVVRGYLRKNLKNKPQRVTGEMLIRDNPRLYASGGKFTAELTVFLSIKEVVSYEAF